MKGMLRVLVRLYGLVLELYPRGHREQYGAEMRAVFALTVEAARREGSLAVVRLCVRELHDLPAALYQAHRRARRMGEMRGETDGTLSLDAGSWAQAMSAALPFLVAGLWAVSNALPASLVGGWWRYLWIWLLLAGYLGALMGFVLGWVKGFPRWSYGYVLCFPLWSWDLGALRISRHAYLGWGSVVPLGVAALVALGISRSFRPLLRLIKGVLEDWTQLSFALYSMATWLLWVAFDEVRDDYELPFAIAVNAILIAGALVYIRVAGRWRRALSLIAGLGAAWVVMAVGTAFYWHGRTVGLGREPLNGFVEAGRTVSVLPIAVALLLAPALLSLLCRFVRSGRFSSSA